MAEEPVSDVELPLGDHIDELRRRLIFALIGVGIVTVVMLAVGKHLMVILYHPLAAELRAQQLPPVAETLAPIEGFSTYLKVSFIAGLILATPWVMYQGWRFVSIGMYSHERKIMHVLAPLSTVMTALGLLFMYYLMLPICLWFFISFTLTFPPPGDAGGSMISRLLNQAAGSASPALPPRSPDEQASQPELKVPILLQDPADPSDGDVWILSPKRELRVRFNGQTKQVALTPPLQSMLMPRFRISEYINFVLFLAIGIVIAFQTPVVQLILGWTGLVDPAWLAKYRGYCVFACFAMGMILTPSDPFSMVTLAIPLWGLFEFGLILMRIVYKGNVADEPTDA